MGVRASSGALEQLSSRKDEMMGHDFNTTQKLVKTAAMLIAELVSAPEEKVMSVEEVNTVVKFVEETNVMIFEKKWSVAMVLSLVICLMGKVGTKSDELMSMAAASYIMQKDGISTATVLQFIDYQADLMVEKAKAKAAGNPPSMFSEADKALLKSIGINADLL